jgi:hypothetical protein
MKLMMRREDGARGFPVRQPGSIPRTRFTKGGSAGKTPGFGRPQNPEGLMNGNVVQILKRWGDFTYTASRPVNDNYSTALSLIQGLRFFGTDVRDFSKFVAESCGHGQPVSEPVFSKKLGIFLSALINSSPNRSCIIDVQDFDESSAPAYLCYANTKNVIILGDVSSDLGTFMVEGSILVKGNARSSVGTFMRSGNITVEGNARGPIGEEMRCGAVIRVNGEIAGVRWPLDGDIYHKGKRVTYSVPSTHFLDS